MIAPFRPHPLCYTPSGKNAPCLEPLFANSRSDEAVSLVWLASRQGSAPHGKPMQPSTGSVPAKKNQLWRDNRFYELKLSELYGHMCEWLMLSWRLHRNKKMRLRRDKRRRLHSLGYLSIKMTIKIKCAHDHHDLCVKGWIKCFADSQIDDSLYKLFI
jgi:hypothetical protein